MTEKNAAEWCVELWGSDPEEMNDDCWTVIGFDSREAAEIFYKNPTADKFPSYSPAHSTAWIALAFSNQDHSIHDLIGAKENPFYDAKRAERERERDDDEWRSERRMQAGMGGGCDWYNDAD